MQAQEEIRFYRPNHLHGYLSNFYPAPFTKDHLLYPTSEHYFQAIKFHPHPHAATVRNASSPGQAFKLGRDRKHPIREDWPEVKEEVMYEALRLKFKTHPDLGAQLLGTADARLVEHTPRDSYWGDGGTGKGKNRLGVLLMKLRE